MDLLSLVATLSLDSSEYENGLGQAESRVGSVGKKLGSALSGAAKVGVAAVGAATAAVGAFAKSALDSGSEFDSSMSQVAATLGITTDDIENNIDGAGDRFAALRAKAQEMGAATNFSASEAAEGLNILAMSGFSAEQSMDMLEDVLHLAAAGGMDMASAASYISGSMKGFADDSKDATYYADLMAKGATLANTSVTELGEAMSSGAAGAAAYSQSQESMTIALLRLAEQGEAGAAAGTALSAAMKNIYTPTDQAKTALEELGVAAYDSEGNARDFNDVVNELDYALQGMSEAEANAYKNTIFGIQGLDAFNKMTVTGVMTQYEWSQALSAASDGAGEAAKQYNTMTDNLQGDVDIWNSALDGFKIAISDQLMPTIREFVQFGSDGVGQITAAFQEGGFSGAMEAFGQVLSDGLAMITEMLPQMVDAGMQLLSSLGEGILTNLPTLVSTATEIVLQLGTFIIQALPQLITAAAQIITELATNIAAAIPQLVPTIVEVVIGIVNALIDNVSMLVDAAVEIMTALANALIDNLPTLIEQAPILIEKLVSAIVENVPKLAEASLQIILQLVASIAENLPQIVTAGGYVVTSMINGITALLSNMLQSGKDMINQVWEGIKSLDPVQWGKDLISNFIDGLKGAWEALKGGITDIAQGIKDFLGFSEPKKGPLSDFHTYAPDMMQLYAEGIRDNAHLVEDQLNKSLNFDNEFGINATGALGNSGGQNNNVTINVYGAEGQDESKIAENIADILRNQVLSRGAVSA